jgi:hypothetical protein
MPLPGQSSEITLRHTTLGRTPHDEGLYRRGDPYMTTHNIHKTDFHATHQAGFEPANPASERPQTYTSVRGSHRDRHMGYLRLQKF